MSRKPAEQFETRDKTDNYTCFVREATQDALTGILVKSMGYFRQRPPEQRCIERIFGWYAAVWLPQGHGTFESAPTGKVSFEQGTLLWIFPTVRHSYSPLERGWTEHWVAFGGRGAKACERQGLLKPERAVQCFWSAPEITELFTRLYWAFTHEHAVALRLRAALVYELILMVNALERGERSLELGDDSRALVDRALSLIQAEATLGLQPEQVAERLQVGYSTLRKKFAARTGGSIKDALLREQFACARALLTNPDYSIEEVARKCGFEDPFYFSKVFRAREGQTPSAFRHQVSSYRV